MVFNSVSEQQRREFFKQGYNCHLPGYTGHCPTLKFRVGKRYGACTEEIMKELIEKKILKSGPYRPHSASKENLPPVHREKDNRRDRKKESYLYKTPPYVLGYTGYIPGYSSRYGLTFMKAVEEGFVEWRENQSKIRVRRDAMRAHAERADPRNLLSRVRADNVNVEIDHGHSRRRQYFDNIVSADSPPIVGYTGHIPGAKGEVALSKRYGLAAKRGLELFEKERKSRLNSAKDANDAAHQRVLEVCNLDETGQVKP